VDAEGEGGVVASGEGVGGVGEEGDDRGGADVDDGGELLGNVTTAIGCAQRQRVRARQRRVRCGRKQRNEGPSTHRCQ